EAYSQDTRVLLRGYPATAAAAWDSTQLDQDGLPIHGDYFVKNRNTYSSTIGTAAYLGGDSFDGRPDGLRMIWLGMYNFNFAPHSAELARSSTVPFEEPDGGDYHGGGVQYALQGTFTQANYDLSRYTPTYNSVNDQFRWIYPEERGHFRQLNEGIVGGLCTPVSANACLSTPNACCPSQVTAGSQGSNTAGFDDFDDYANLVLPSGCAKPATSSPPRCGSTQCDFWDTSSQSWQTVGDTMLYNDAPTAANAAKDRVIFTHLYAPIGAGAGLAPVWLSPNSTAAAGPKLACALYPEGCKSGALACPDGTNCLFGAPACEGCTAPDPFGGAVSPTAWSSTDVTALLTDVSLANGGCVPLLKDVCYGPGSPQLACLDHCWAQCVGTSTACSKWNGSPPAPKGCGDCAHQCAQSCNTGPGNSQGNCGVGTAQSPTNFRALCYGSLGGVDHATAAVLRPEVSQLSPAPKLQPGATYDMYCRPTVSFVGAADGMLHAIYLDDPPAARPDGTACSGGIPKAPNGQAYVSGQEVWAFVPNQNLPILRSNGDCSRSLFVDGVPQLKTVLADVGDGNGTTWHTVLTDTLGQGGNHVFALDVTDPMLPVEGTVSDGTLAAKRVILWENGDPLDPTEPQPYPSGSSVVYSPPNSGSTPYADVPPAAEGPGFNGAAATPNPLCAGQPYCGSFLHYLGKSASTAVGTLSGAGITQSITYVAGQNGMGGPVDGYGRAISLADNLSCKVGQDVQSPPTCGPNGEVIYAFDTATGLPRTIPTGGKPQLVHFTQLYESGTLAGGASGNWSRTYGNDDIPAPLLPISLVQTGCQAGGSPTPNAASFTGQTQALIVPSLDGRVWGLDPSTLVSLQTTQSCSYGFDQSFDFPLFDMANYRGPYSGTGQQAAIYAPSGCGGYSHASWQSAVLGAPFGNPATFVPPGTCGCGSASSEDSVVLLPTGGVDWAPPASVVLALDPSQNGSDLVNCKAGGCTACVNGGSNEPFPVQGGSACAPLITGTCDSCLAENIPAGNCVGRVYGAILDVGTTAYFAASSGQLTGNGATISQQGGDGFIGSFSICAGVDGGTALPTTLAEGVGKVASGLSAGTPGANGAVQVFSASTTGMHNVAAVATPAAAVTKPPPLMQHWWSSSARSSGSDGTNTCQ
ncbi:MAG: hypothetical protein ACYCWW_10595, partial [Deltaproteobacteria bacterium]